MKCSECDKDVIAKGLCMTHYRRMLRNNTLELTIKKNVTFCEICGKTDTKFLAGKCISCYYKNYRKKNISFQYQKRLEYKAKEKDFYWNDYNLDLKETVIKPVTIKTAKEIIEKYEYLGKISAINLFSFGIFFKHKNNDTELCGGVVIFGNDYTENLGVWDKYNYTGKILLLNRGACLHWTPKNTASKLIMGSLKQLPDKYKIITVMVDNEAGEIGTIYQACNFLYVGQMRKSNNRVGVILNGKKYTSLSIRKKYGTINKTKLKQLLPNIEFIENKSKKRYFYFLGNRTEKKKNKEKIQHLIKPYPKRA